MNCKKAWSQNFLITKLNRSFISNDYKVHRKTLLLEREISKLPETIIIAEKVKKCEIKEKEANEIKDKKILQVAEEGTQNILDSIPLKCKIIFPSTHVVYEGLNEVKKNILEDEKLCPLLSYAN